MLSALTDAELLRRIEPAGSPARYETRVGDNHHHLVCRDCGEVEDVDCAVGEAPCLHASDERGFAIDEAEVIFWGQLRGLPRRRARGARSSRRPTRGRGRPRAPRARAARTASA